MADAILEIRNLSIFLAGVCIRIYVKGLPSIILLIDPTLYHSVQYIEN